MRRRRRSEYCNAVDDESLRREEEEPSISCTREQCYVLSPVMKVDLRRILGLRDMMIRHDIITLYDWGILHTRN